jgi:transcriptional regulator with XRE-family HTH domain
MKVTGIKIKRLREFNGMTQKKLGQLLGFSEAHISLIESGKRNIGNSELKKISEIFNVPLKDIIGNSSYSNNHFRSVKTSNGNEIIDPKLWEDFIDFAKKS